MDVRSYTLPQQLSQDAELVARFCDAVLAHTMSAAFVVDRDLSVLHASGRADALLHGAGPLRRHQGRLIADTSDGTPALAALVTEAIAAAHLMEARPTALPSLCLHRHGLPPLVVSVAPLVTAGGAYAVVFVREPAAATASAPALQQLFDLTPSEAAVAKALAEGGSLEQIAQSQHVSVNTVKTHIHHVYRKTATSRQGELIALIHGACGMAPSVQQAQQSRPPHPSG